MFEQILFGRQKIATWTKAKIVVGLIILLIMWIAALVISRCIIQFSTEAKVEIIDEIVTVSKTRLQKYPVSKWD